MTPTGSILLKALGVRSFLYMRDQVSCLFTMTTYLHLVSSLGMSSSLLPLHHCYRGMPKGNAFQHNLHKYSLVLVRRHLFRQHSRGQSILRFNPLYICSRKLASFVRTVPKYLNFAVQADRSSYGLDIRQMMLFISCLQQSAPSDYFAWLAVCEPRDRPQRRSALDVTQ